jgi:hypothetical protein
MRRQGAARPLTDAWQVLGKLKGFGDLTKT